MISNRIGYHFINQQIRQKEKNFPSALFVFGFSIQNALQIFVQPLMNKYDRLLRTWSMI